MILTHHARERVKQRFPELAGVKLLEQFEQRRRPTAAEAEIILRHSRAKGIDVGDRCVSPLGIVFVVREGAVITLFRLDEEPGFKGPCQSRAWKKAQRKPGERRTKEKWWTRAENV